MDRTERQKFGIKKWMEAGCRGTLNWATGTGGFDGTIKMFILNY